MDVDGLRCLVAGTASGIGDAVTRLLMTLGAEVVSLDRNEPTAPVASHVAIDLGDPASIDRAVGHLEGPFDALLNVAGIPGTYPGDQVLRVNFLGLRHLTEMMFARLNPGGAIVNVSSVAGFGWPNRLPALSALMATSSFDEGLAWFKANPQEGNAYNFSKEAATVYTMWTGLAARQRELRINAVLPGAVDTPILVDFEESMGKDTLNGVKELLGRHATPEDIAPAVVFLASRDSGWLNGTTITADGGLTGAVAVGQVPPPEV